MTVFDKFGYTFIAIYMFACLVWSYIPENRYLYYICALILGTIMLFDLIKHGFHFVRSKLNVSFECFLLVGLLSVLWGVNTSKTIEQCVSLLINYVFIILIMNFICYRKNAGRRLLTILCASGVAMSMYYIISEGVNTLVVQLLYGMRIGKEIGNENINGGFAVFSSLLSIFFYKTGIDKRWIYSVPFTLFFALGSGSRVVVVLLIVGLIGVYWATTEKQKNMVKMILYVLLVLLFVRILLNLPIFSAINERFTELISFSQTGETVSRSLDFRQIMIEYGLKSFYSMPFTGVGLGNTSTIISFAFKNIDYPYLHNNYVELLASVGIFGFLAYYSIYYFSIKAIIPYIKKRDNTAKMISLLLLLLLLNDYSNVTYYKSMYYLLFFMPMVYENNFKRTIIKKKNYL